MTKEECDKIYKFIDENVDPLRRHYYVGDAEITEKGKLMLNLRHLLASMSDEYSDA